MEMMLDTGGEINFEMEIEGSSGPAESVRLMMESGKGYELCFNGPPDSRKMVFSIPCLEGVVEPGERKVHLEVVVDGKFYRPLTESVRFIKPVKVVAKTGEKIESKNQTLKFNTKNTSIGIGDLVKFENHTGKVIKVMPEGKYFVESDGKSFVVSRPEMTKL